MTATVSPLLTVPLSLVYDQPLMAYVPPVMEIAAAALIPDTVIVLDVTTVLRGTSVWSVNVNGSGTVSASVVTLNVSDTQPMVSVALIVVV